MKSEEALQAMREGKKCKPISWLRPIKIKNTHELVWCHDSPNKPYLCHDVIINEEWEIIE